MHRADRFSPCGPPVARNHSNRRQPCTKLRLTGATFGPGRDRCGVAISPLGEAWLCPIRSVSCSVTVPRSQAEREFFPTRAVWSQFRTQQVCSPPALSFAYRASLSMLLQELLKIDDQDAHGASNAHMRKGAAGNQEPDVVFGEPRGPSRLRHGNGELWGNLMGFGGTHAPIEQLWGSLCPGANC